jgi:divalent metal cation (Fe/Co/Zn/Cd) transporter
MASTPLPTLPVSPAIDHDRPALVRRARQLAWWGVGWHAIEATVAIAAGVAASSVALVGFGADSLVESFAGFVVVWRFASSRASSEHAERRAQKLIAASFCLIAMYVGVEAVRSLTGGREPAASWVGIGLAVVTLVMMPPLANVKARLADRLGSSAAKSEGRQNMLCAYLSAALLAGLLANALFGWWWADPVTALVIAGVAVKEARSAWAGDACCTAPIGLDDRCSNACCAHD